MNLKAAILSALIFLVFLATPGQARLGETVGQSQARYGAPAPALLTADEKPLVEGVKDAAYKYQGWRIRVAFIDSVAVRVEYAHLPEDGAQKPITEAEAAAILDAERATLHWREAKNKPTGDIGKDIGTALAGVFAGKIWERPDRATATLKLGNTALLLELPAAAAYEKKMQKTGKTAVPKF